MTTVMTMWSHITVIIPRVPTKLQALECVFCFLLVLKATQGGTFYYSIIQLTEEEVEAQLPRIHLDGDSGRAEFWNRVYALMPSTTYSGLGCSELTSGA